MENLPKGVQPVFKKGRVWEKLKSGREGRSVEKKDWVEFRGKGGRG